MSEITNQNSGIVANIVPRKPIMPIAGGAGILHSAGNSPTRIAQADPLNRCLCGKQCEAAPNSHPWDYTGDICAVAYLTPAGRA